VLSSSFCCDASRSLRSSLSLVSVWIVAVCCASMLIMNGWDMLAVVYNADFTSTYHGKVLEAITPGELQDDIWFDEIEAGVKHADVALAAANVNELE
jgi:hypothetical protein